MLSPTIQGIFVMSHIDAVRRSKGRDGVLELERKLGKTLDFRATESVPIVEELRIIDAALDVLKTLPIPPLQRDYEAGRLHFRNFSTTPLGEFLLSIFREDFKIVMLRAPAIANLVFQGVTFSAIDTGPNMVRVTMSNAAYPLEHFHGLFSEWMRFSNLRGAVEATTGPGGECIYTMKWL